MGIYTKEEQFELIEKDWRNLKDIENQYADVCIKAVKQNRFALKYVKDQTEDICLEAVKQNGLVLEYIDREYQTKEICKAIPTGAVARL